MPIIMRYTAGSDYDAAVSVTLAPAIPDRAGDLLFRYVPGYANRVEWTWRGSSAADTGEYVVPASVGWFVDASTSLARVVIALAAQSVHDNVIVGSMLDDEVASGWGDDWLSGGGGHDLLTGGAGDDWLDGGDGDDILFGDSGTDWLDGGAGNDVLLVNSGADLVIEAVGGGHDRVETAGSYVLPEDAEIEELVAVGERAVLLVGNGFANALRGTLFADRLDGGEGNDVLDGAGGDDVMIGGAGDDLFRVDAAGDRVIDTVGFDTVEATTSYALEDNARIGRMVAVSDGIEAITLVGNRYTKELVGSAFADALIGGIGHETLIGGGGSDRLEGGAGSDTLDGGTGNDAMAGGIGNDTYIVDSLRDRVSEGLDAGRDTVRTGLAAYTLPANVEDLISDGYAGSAGVVFAGNLLSNRIVGTRYADTLYDARATDFASGTAGAADQLVGGAGDDTYRITAATTRVIETANGGVDTVEATAAFRLPDFVEHLVLADIGGAIGGFGNALDNRLTGNASDNRLSGEDGADRIDGGGGADVLTGGLGADVFVVSAAGHSTPAAADTIADFLKGTDRIDLTTIAAQPLAWIGTRAFGGVAGELRYELGSNRTIVSADVDGDGAADLQLTLTGRITLAASDFLL